MQFPQVLYQFCFYCLVFLLFGGGAGIIDRFANDYIECYSTSLSGPSKVKCLAQAFLLWLAKKTKAARISMYIVAWYYGRFKVLAIRVI